MEKAMPNLIIRCKVSSRGDSEIMDFSGKHNNSELTSSSFDAESKRRIEAAYLSTPYEIDIEEVYLGEDVTKKISPSTSHTEFSANTTAGTECTQYWKQSRNIWCFAGWPCVWAKGLLSGVLNTCQCLSCPQTASSAANIRIISTSSEFSDRPKIRKKRFTTAITIVNIIASRKENYKNPLQFA